MNARRALAGLPVLAALVILLGACGAAESPAEPSGPVPPAQSQPVASEAASDAVVSAEPVETTAAAAIPTAVVQLGVEQVLRIDGQIIGRVKVLSYDPADDGVAIEVNSGIAPFVVEPSDFTMTDASGAAIVGIASNPNWDRDLAANDQTMGQVRFVGATAPVSITYAPEGAEPLIWSFS